MLKMISASICGLLLAGVIAAPSALADDGLIRVESKHGAVATIDRLVSVLEKAGATIFARIDHAKGAAGVGVEMAPNQALIFGNPKIGSEPIVASPTAGLDLPLRVVAYDQDGKTWLVYRDPAAFAAAHGLPADHPKIVMMSGVLKKVTGKAAGE